MNKRRKLVIALGASALTTLISFAQRRVAVPRLGILGSGPITDRPHTVFIQALRELGYVEGSNILIERRFAEGNLTLLPALAADLIKQNVDVIYAPNTPAVRAAKGAAGTIPIVFATVGDPVGEHFVESLGRPGRNITGTTNVSSELSAKRLQLLKETVPRISRVAVLITYEANATGQLDEVRRAAKALNLEVTSSQLRNREDIGATLETLRKWRADSIYVAISPTNFLNRQLLAEFAAKIKLPAVYPTREFADAGGLLAYGPNYDALYKRAAIYVDKILKGAKPSELPVEQPTTFELIINQKTAKTLGIKIPQSLLISADKVIE